MASGDKFKIDIIAVGESIQMYEKVIKEIEEEVVKLDNAIRTYGDEAWSGVAKDEFINIYNTWKEDNEKYILEQMKDYVNNIKDNLPNSQVLLDRGKKLEIQ